MTTSHNSQAKKDDFEDAWKRHRILVRVGQALMIVGAGVAIVHWLTHLEVFGPTQPPLWADLVAGYPAGGLLFMIGAVFAGRKRPTLKQYK